MSENRQLVQSISGVSPSSSDSSERASRPSGGDCERRCERRRDAWRCGGRLRDRRLRGGPRCDRPEGGSRSCHLSGSRCVRRRPEAGRKRAGVLSLGGDHQKQMRPRVRARRERFSVQNGIGGGPGAPRHGPARHAIPCVAPRRMRRRSWTSAKPAEPGHSMGPATSSPATRPRSTTPRTSPRTPLGAGSRSRGRGAHGRDRWPRPAPYRLGPGCTQPRVRTGPSLRGSAR